MDSAQFIIELEAQMKGLSGAVGDLNKLEQNLQKLNTSSKTGEEGLKKAGAGVGKFGKEAHKAGGITGFFANTHIFALRRAMEHMGGPLGGVIGHIFRFGEGLHKMAKAGGTIGLLTGGALIAGGAIATLAAKMIEGAAAALKYGLEMADAGREQADTLEAMEGGKAAGDQLSGAFEGIEKATGASSERLMSLTEELGNAHLSAADMATAVGAIAEQEAAIGEGKTKTLIDQLNAGTTSANALANTIDKKYGGVVKDKMLELGNQFKVLKTTAGETFGGLKTTAMEAGLQHLIGLLDDTTVSGKAIKFLFESVFQPLVDAATSAFPYVELFVLRFVNTLLRMYLTMKPTMDKISKALGIKPGNGIETALKAAGMAGTAFAVAVAVVIVIAEALIDVFVGMVNTASMIGSAFSSVGSAVSNLASAGWADIKGAINSVGGAFDKIPTLFSAGIDYIEGLPAKFVAIGGALIDGLVNGILAGAQRAVAAITSVGSNVTAAAKASFGQHSPSRIFHEIGVQNTEGLALGHEAGAPRIKSSIENMSELPASSPMRGASGGKSGNVFHIEIHANGADGKKLAKTIRQELEDFFEDKAIELGTAPEATAA